MSKRKRNRFKVRNATIEDMGALLALERVAWPENNRADEATYRARLEVFPKGIFIGETEQGDIEGVAVTQLIRSEFLEKDFNWATITDNGTIRGTHDEDGNVVYGVNLSVLPKHMGNGITSAIMEAIAKMAVERNLKVGALGGRLPGLARFFRRRRLNPHTMPIKERDEIVRQYIFGNTKSGRSLDPEIEIYKRSGLKPIRPLREYFPDLPSLNYGVLLIWDNPLYNRTLIRRLIKPFFRLPS